MAAQHFAFESLQFAEVLAHSGRRPILFKRVLERTERYHFVDLSIVPPGADIGIHTHTADNEEFYVIVSGEGLMHLDGATFPVGPGHVIINRPGGTHGLVNTGTTPLRLVVFELPSGSRPHPEGSAR
jgi:mannose-6-phosphate isomerase-like protein (cupin superfamily)